ncbi:MAG: hypothetical protein ABIF08_03105 [Nanoarchaeota archaeon]
MVNGEYGRRNIRDILNELIERTNSIIMRLRIVEQRNNTTVTKINSLQAESLEQLNESKVFIKKFEKKMQLYEEGLLKMESVMKELSKKINDTATKSEIMGLREALKIYNPIKSQFVTRRELKKIMEDGGK